MKREKEPNVTPSDVTYLLGYIIVESNIIINTRIIKGY